MHPQPHVDFTISWLGILVLAGIVTALIAAVQHPSARPRLFLAVALVVAGFVVLRFLAMPAPLDVPIGNGEVAAFNRVSSARTAGLLVVLLPLILGGAFFAARRRHGHGPWWLAIPAALLFFWFGALFSYRNQHVIPPPRVVSAEHFTDAAAIPPLSAPHVGHSEPVDELWMRLNEPRIQLTPPPTQPGPAATIPTASSLPAEAEVDHSHSEAGTESAESDNWEAAASAATEQAKAARELAFDAALKAETGKEANKASITLPAWVGQPPRMVGEVYRVSVEAGPYSSLEECYRSLRENMRKALNDRIVELVRDATGKPYVHVPSLEYLNLGNSFIDRELRREDPYVEVSETSVGPMKTAWALLEFTPQHDQQLVDAWKRYARREGIAKTSVLAVLVLMVLGGVFVLLQIDTWTRGYYTKRLFLGVPAAIIAVIVFLVLANA